MELLGRIAQDVSLRYARRCWWADPEDLLQQAWAVVLEVLREYPPLLPCGGLDEDALGAFAWRAAMRQLSRYLWRQSSPVSAGDHDVKELAGVFHLEVDPTVPDPVQTPEEQAQVSEARTRLRLRMAELISVQPLLPCPWTEAAARVLLDGDLPREASRDLGLPSDGVHKQTYAAKVALRADPQSMELLEQLAERRYG